MELKEKINELTNENIQLKNEITYLKKDADITAKKALDYIKALEIENDKLKNEISNLRKENEKLKKSNK